MQISTLENDNGKSKGELDLPLVVLVALDRPSKRNALNSTMWKEIGRFFGGRLMEAIPSCRAVLLYGNGTDFCAGIDLSDPNFLPQPSSCVAHTGISFLPKLQQMQDCFSVLETECPVPIVAAVHGNCIGAGVDLLCCTDICIANDQTMLPGKDGSMAVLPTKFSIREVALGLAADVGTLQRLPKRTGNQSLVRQYCLTGETFSAHDAKQMGLLARVLGAANGTAPSLFDLLQDGVHLCQIMAQHSPVAVRGTKQAILYARDHSVDDGLRQVGLYNALALQSRDLQLSWKAQLKSKRSDKVAKKTGPKKSVARYLDVPRHSKL